MLIIESHWTETAGAKVIIKNVETNTSCISEENFKVISECHPCSDFEIASQSIGICAKGRFKEVIECESGEKITRRYFCHL